MNELSELNALEKKSQDLSSQIVQNLWKYPLTFKEHEFWLKEFLLNAQRMNKSQHTLLNYRADLLKFLRWYEKNFNHVITFADAESIGLYKSYLSGEFLRPLKKNPHKFWTLLSKLKDLWPTSKTPLIKEIPVPLTPLAMASRKRHISCIKNFFEFLKQTHEGLPGKRGQLFLHNPVKSKLHSIKLKDVDIEHTPLLSTSDWEVLEMKATRPRERAMIFLLYFGGLRLAELGKICWQDLHYSERAVDLIRKGGHRQTLKLREGDLVFREIRRLSESLSRLGMTPDQESPLFPGKKGQFMSERGLAKIIKALFKRANLSSDISPHSFRKACATEMYLETRDLLAVRDYLNHADAKVTQTYIDKLALLRDREIVR